MEQNFRKVISCLFLDFLGKNGRRQASSPSNAVKVSLTVNSVTAKGTSNEVHKSALKIHESMKVQVACRFLLKPGFSKQRRNVLINRESKC